MDEDSNPCSRAAGRQSRGKVVRAYWGMAHQRTQWTRKTYYTGQSAHWGAVVQTWQRTGWWKAANDLVIESKVTITPVRGKIPQSDTVMCGMSDRLDTNKKLIKPLTCFEPILFQFRTWICKITGDGSNVWWYHPWLIAWEAIGISNMHKQTHWLCICWLGWTDCGCAAILISQSLFCRQLEFRDADSWTQRGTNHQEGAER